MLRHRTLLRLIALKMASMLALFVLASCGSNFDELEQGEDELAQEQAQVWEQAQQLRAAERRATAAQAQVWEQAQQLRAAEHRATATQAQVWEQAQQLRAAEHRATAAQAQVWEQAQQLRAAERRATATQAQVREQAQQLLDDDIPQGWRISEDEASNLLRDGNEGCNLCYARASLFNHGSCRCSNTACGKIICKQCYRSCRQSDIRGVNTRCSFCRSSFLDE